MVTEAISPEIISSIFAALRREFTPSASARLGLLENFSGIGSFEFTLSLVPDADLLCLADVFHELAVDVREEILIGRLNLMKILYAVHK